MPMTASVRSLKGVGEKRAALYEKLGIRTLWDLVSHYPRGYEDWSNPCLISEAQAGVHISIIYGDYFYAEALLKLLGSDFLPW